VSELSEGELTRQINAYESALVDLYRARRGKMVDNSWGWCIGCGKVMVCAAGGDDTCGGCRAAT
jgi:hypothetical protein